MKTGIQIIEEERIRQKTIEKWSTGHDDEHTEGEMAKAAACYCLGNNYNWPWNLEWWKPSPENRIRDLAKAGALVAAEIDRLQRIDVTNKKSARKKKPKLDNRNK